MLVKEMWEEYQLEVQAAEEYCEEQGLPSNGSTFEVMLDDIRQRYHMLFDQED